MQNVKKIKVLSLITLTLGIFLLSGCSAMNSTTGSTTKLATQAEKDALQLLAGKPSFMSGSSTQAASLGLSNGFRAQGLKASRIDSTTVTLEGIGYPMTETGYVTINSQLYYVVANETATPSRSVYMSRYTDSGKTSSEVIQEIENTVFQTHFLGTLTYSGQARSFVNTGYVIYKGATEGSVLARLNINNCTLTIANTQSSQTSQASISMPFTLIVGSQTFTGTFAADGIYADVNELTSTLYSSDGTRQVGQIKISNSAIQVSVYNQAGQLEELVAIQ